MASYITYRLGSGSRSTNTADAEKANGLSNQDIDNNFHTLKEKKLENNGWTGGDILYANSSGNLVANNGALSFDSTTNTLNATSFNSLSDTRFKKDLAKIDDALSKVKELSGYTFTLLENNERSTGLLAQDVKRVLPEAIGGNEDKLTVSYGNMMGLIVEAIKELDDKLEEIRNTLFNK